eukprot:superscaffoldBa00001550_g11044
MVNTPTRIPLPGVRCQRAHQGHGNRTITPVFRESEPDRLTKQRFREDQEERGMQPQGSGLDPGHLPVQVSLSGYPCLTGHRKSHGGARPELRASNLSVLKD